MSNKGNHTPAPGVYTMYIIYNYYHYHEFNINYIY